MLAWLKKQWKDWQRWKEADRRGWGSLGRMFAYGREWSDAKWGREIRGIETAQQSNNFLN